MSDNLTIANLQETALLYLEKNLDKHYTYHNALHTREVCAAAMEFAGCAMLNPAECQALHLAAIFHDFGYLVSSHDNEALALPYLQDFGQRFNISADLIARAHRLILETVFPYHPVSEAGKLLCDADIEYSGRPCFLSKAELFRQELAAENIIFEDREFLTLEIKFLEENSFFTDICKNLRRRGQLENLQKLRDMLHQFDSRMN